MKNITYVPIRNDLLVRLINRGGEHYDGLIEHAVEDFLDRTEEDYGDGQSFLSSGGFSWDQVFLPEESSLRTRYKGEWRTAKVAKGRFEYAGSTYDSPSKVCNAMRDDTSNNAWITLEVRRPQDVAFRLADRFRK